MSVSVAELQTRPRHSVSALARIAEVSTSTVWRWVTHGMRGVKLPVHRIGGRRFVFADQFDAFLTATSSESAAPITQSATA